MSTLGQRVADAVVAHFEQVPGKAGKPTTRPNGVAEWTVLAGLVAIEGETLTVLAVATGVKAMPDAVRMYSRGLIVHDMHAEILCLRMFNWYVMEEVRGAAPRRFLEQDPQDPQDPQGLPAMPRQFRWKPSAKLALYVSEPPCGDASMSHVAQGQAAWADEPPLKKHQAVRGRAGFGNLGVVRTKPGRADSRVSYLKLCSDKLCAKQFTGVLNCVSSVRVAPVFLDFLVVDEDKHRGPDFRRCFADRLLAPPPHALRVLTCGPTAYAYGQAPGRVPLPLGMVCCPVTGATHVLSQGVRNGAHVKNGPPKARGASPLCRRNLWAQAQGELPAHGTYAQLKRANPERARRKLAARAALGQWPPCAAEDFSL